MSMKQKHALGAGIEMYEFYLDMGIRCKASDLYLLHRIVFPHFVLV